MKFKYMTGSRTITAPDATLKALLSPVVSAYFDVKQQDKNDFISLLARVHVRSEVHKMNLAQTINKLQALEPLITKSPQETISFSEQSLLKPDGKDLGTFVINVSYQSLNRVHEIEKELKQWYLTYSDIVS